MGGLKELKRRRMVAEAIQWLKDRGMNPHASRSSVQWKKGSPKDWRAHLNTRTGIISLNTSKNITVGVIAHELIHLADYYRMIGGNKRGRQEIYKNWESARVPEGIEEIMKMVWRAGASRSKEKCEGREKKKERKEQFTVLSEIPAYMVSEVLEGRAPEEGLQTAKKIITSEKYFGETELEGVARKAADNYLHLAHTLRKKGLDDEQIVRAILALHKNVYTPEDAEMLVQNKRMLGNAAEAVKAGGFDAGDIRTALAVQTLVRMDESVRRWPRLAGAAGRIRLDKRR